MANEEHLAKLKEGVEVWNQWREDHLPLTKPDLSGAHLYRFDLRHANLRQADLAGANLRQADLAGANLSGADLGRANLSGADLDRTNLSGANLGHAILHIANLHEANLSKADLRGANLHNANLYETNLSKVDLSGTALTGANLNRTDLRGANFSDAYLSDTIFSNTVLTDAKGLENCRHITSSIIDHRTLQQSSPLPLTFLRGCGLPEMLIDYLPSLLNQPIQYYSCFISYSHRDEAFAQRLYADLQNHGVRCWYAPEDMKIGDQIRTRLDEVIHIHDKLLLILSEHSVISDWVEKEVETAFDKEKQRGETVLFPIRLDSAVKNSKTGWAADIRRSRHIGDFSGWKDHDQYQNTFERLMRDLKSEPSDDNQSH